MKGSTPGAFGLGKRRSQLSAKRTTTTTLSPPCQRLAAYGFEPDHGDRGEVRLRNCPSRSLVEQHHDLVRCTNFEFMQGVVQGVQIQGIEGFFEEVPKHCCVVFYPRQGRKHEGAHRGDISLLTDLPEAER